MAHPTPASQHSLAATSTQNPIFASQAQHTRRAARKFRVVSEVPVANPNAYTVVISPAPPDTTSSLRHPYPIPHLNVSRVYVSRTRTANMAWWRSGGDAGLPRCGEMGRYARVRDRGGVGMLRLGWSDLRGRGRGMVLRP
jgi:hypothetical protein